MSATLHAQLDSVLADWAWFLDHGRFDELAELFTPDGQLITQGARVRGQEQIRQRYLSRTGVRTSRHVYSGLRVTESSDAWARTTSVWVCYAANLPAPVDEAGVYLVADCLDEFVRGDDGRWRISSREIVPVLRDPARKPVTA